MSIVGKIKRAARKVKDWLTDKGEKAADKLDEETSAAQNLLMQAAQWIDKRVPVLGLVIAKILEWTSAVIGSLSDLIISIIKGAFAIVGGVVGGIINIFSGHFKEGVLDILNGIVGAILIGLGSFISLIQTIFAIEARKRRLNNIELAMLQNVYCVSVNLLRIKIVQSSSGIFDFINDRPFTMGDVIYMKRTIASEWDPTLVHETCHVWQYQNVGPTYSSEALSQQVYYQAQRRSAYNWWDPDVNHDNMVWEDWNREAQAAFIEDLFLGGDLVTGTTSDPRVNGIFFNDLSGTTKRRIFIFTGPRPTHPNALDRWNRIYPPRTTIDATAAALDARLILHQGCNRT